MSENYAYSIDIEKVSSSSEKMDFLINLLNTTELLDYIIDAEGIIKKINFEHGNCINEYKNMINALINDINILKKEVVGLDNSLETTIKKYAKLENLNEMDLTELNKLYGNSLSKLLVPENNNIQVAAKKILNNIGNVGDVTQIPPVTQEETPQQEPINTIPIGLGIAAAGITGAIGAVVVDSMNDKKEKQLEDNLESYQEDEEVVNSSDYIPKPAPVMESAEPYHASRKRESIDKFYGQNHEYYEEEDE